MLHTRGLAARLAKPGHHTRGRMPAMPDEAWLTAEAPGAYLELIRKSRQEAAVGAEEAAVQVAAGQVERTQARRLQVLHKEVVDEGHVVALQVHGVRVRDLLARPARRSTTTPCFGRKDCCCIRFSNSGGTLLNIPVLRVTLALPGPSAAPRPLRSPMTSGTWLQARTHLMALLAFAYIIPVPKSRPRAQLLLPAWFMRSPKGNM